jgi:hypothetical protein
MKKLRAAILLLCAILVAALVLFPPWWGRTEGGRELYYGYHFILSPPSHSPRVDVARVIGPVAAVCLMAYLAIREIEAKERGAAPSG